jgi:NAD(P)-dependent dehydrogenase (short-subunit alcohol dehydrogenase family)
MAAGTLGANVFITGANRGIGLGMVKEILNVGGLKNLFAGCRNPDAAAVSLLIFKYDYKYKHLVFIMFQFHRTFKTCKNQMRL